MPPSLLLSCCQASSSAVGTLRAAMPTLLNIVLFEKQRERRKKNYGQNDSKAIRDSTSWWYHLPRKFLGWPVEDNRYQSGQGIDG